MNEGTIGKSTISVPHLTLGTMSFPLDKQSVVTLLSRALDQGIIHIDTADLYDFGQNEALLGQFIKHHRDQIVLTTKVGNHFNPKTKDWFWDPSSPYIKTAVKNSLQRLQTDYIDLYLLHGGTIKDPIDESIEAFEQLKKSGTIRAYGISSIRPNVINAYMNKSNIDAVMMQYSMLDRRPEEWLDVLHEQQISVLARGPLAKGMLSSHALSSIVKKGENGYLDYNYNELRQTIEQLLSLDEPLEKLAFQYVLKHPAVVSAVFGASNETQLLTNGQYVNLAPMNDELYQTIQQITKKSFYTMHRE